MTVKPPLSTVPPRFVMATSESIDLDFDTTNLGGPPSSPLFVLTDQNTNAAVPGFTSAPVIDGNVVSQQVNGSLLRIGHIYTLALTFTTSPNTFLMVLTIGPVPV
jgi:hypothetical protein